MGEIRADITLTNHADMILSAAGHMPTTHIRKASLSALVDTGAVLLMLPQDIVEALGLERQRMVIVTYADERKDELPVYGGLKIHIAGRSMLAECVMGPPLCEALVGQLILETLDLLADCQRQALVPRPESPNYPSLKMK